MKVNLSKLAYKEIKFYKMFSLFFIINIAIGIVGLVTIENFKESFSSVLSQRAKTLMGADLAITSRFQISDKQKEIVFDKILANGGVINEYLTMYSMARSETKSRLISVQTLTPSVGIKNAEAVPYPFYGHLELDRKVKFPQSRTYPGQYELWAYPEVVKQLGSKKLKIGKETFTIKKIVTDDSQQAFDVGVVAPKVFMNLADAKSAGLIQKGSTLRHNLLIKSPITISEDLVENVVNEIDDNAIRISTPQQTSEQIGRVLSYLGDFLGLVSLVALFLASVGLLYLYRSYLGQKRMTFAIYSSLGLGRNQIFGIYMRHILILSLLGSLLGISLSSLIIPGLNTILANFLPFELPQLISGKALFMGLSVGILGVLLLSYPLILSSLKNRPASLFQEVAELSGRMSKDKALHFIPYLIFFSLMGLYASQSFRVGGTFLGLFFGTVLLSFPFGGLLLKYAEKISGSLTLRFKLSLRYMVRYKVSTISIFLSLLLGSMLLNLIPLLQQSIQSEVEIGNKSTKPSLFLFDIQDEQIDSLTSFFTKKEIDLLSVSPFIRSRILRVNEEEIKVETKKALTREGQREQRFRNRGTNLSYRDELSASETIVEGEKFPGRYNEEKQKLPLISVEKRYAERLGIKLGDEVEFDILGVPLSAKVHNIRKVQWTSFLPNFFIQFQGGVLDDAPKTWLAAVPKLEKGDLEELQQDLYEHFPNISAVDITRVVEKVLEVMNQMGWALKAMSLFCLVVGVFVLYSLAGHQMEGRKKDIVLLKVLGMSPADLSKMAIGEFVAIGALAGVLGALFGMIISFIVSYLFFDGIFVFNILIPSLSVVSLSVICGVTSWLATRKVLNISSGSFLS